MTKFARVANEGGTTGSRDLLLLLALIAVLTIAVFSPVLGNGFINYDDPDYLLTNMAVRQGLSLKGVAWAFTAYHAGNWHPLTWLSHMLDIELFDLNPIGHHAVNLLFHTLNALLLCVVLRRFTGFVWRSALVAMLFAIHPLHVESVAWISERKDLLSTLFWLFTMAAYARYSDRPSPRRYLPVALLLALGLMAKQMLVTLPVVLLLLDLWPLRRLPDFGWRSLRPLLVEKLPLLAISAAAAVVTLLSQNSAGALGRGHDSDLSLQVGNAILSYLRYIGKMFWPADLALFYPLDPAAVSPLKVAAAAALLAALTLLALWQRRSRPYLLFGWLWYLVTLLPVIGIIRVGSQALADRYSYVPLVGLFVILVWGGAEALGRVRNGGRLGAVLALLVVSLLSLVTVNQIRYWKNSFDLFSHAAQVVPGNWLAHNNLGIVLAQQFRTEEAIGHFRESVRLNPNGAEGYRNLGNACQMAGKGGEALDAFREVVRIDPDDVEGHYRLGYAYLLGGEPQLAYREAEQLMRLDGARGEALMASIRIMGRR